MSRTNARASSAHIPGLWTVCTRSSPLTRCLAFSPKIDVVNYPDLNCVTRLCKPSWKRPPPVTNSRCPHQRLRTNKPYEQPEPHLRKPKQQRTNTPLSLTGRHRTISQTRRSTANHPPTHHGQDETPSPRISSQQDRNPPSMRITNTTTHNP